MFQTILLFGDSLFEQSVSQESGFAFAPALQDYYIRKRELLVRGYSGYNSAHAIKVLPLMMPTPEQVHITDFFCLFGSNDSCLPDSSTGQHVPLEQYAKNLKGIVNHSSIQAHKPRILLITPPPVDEYTMEAIGYTEGSTEILRMASFTKKYADACRQVGEDLSVAVLDLWTIIQSKAGWKPGQPLPGSKDMPRSMLLGDLFRDGLHFTPNGYKILFEAVKDKIEQQWPDQRPEALPPQFPYWSEAPK